MLMIATENLTCHREKAIIVIIQFNSLTPIEKKTYINNIVETLCRLYTDQQKVCVGLLYFYKCVLIYKKCYILLRMQCEIMVVRQRHLNLNSMVWKVRIALIVTFIYTCYCISYIPFYHRTIHTKIIFFLK